MTCAYLGTHPMDFATYRQLRYADREHESVWTWAVDARQAYRRYRERAAAAADGERVALRAGGSDG